MMDDEKKRFFGGFGDWFFFGVEEKGEIGEFKVSFQIDSDRINI